MPHQSIANSAPAFAPPTKDPAFALWLFDLLMNNSGCPVEPYEILSQLEEGTGYSEAELCEVLGFPGNVFAAPEGEGGDD